MSSVMEGTTVYVSRTSCRLPTEAAKTLYAGKRIDMCVASGVGGGRWGVGTMIVNWAANIFFLCLIADCKILLAQAGENSS